MRRLPQPVKEYDAQETTFEQRFPWLRRSGEDFQKDSKVFSELGHKSRNQNLQFSPFRSSVLAEATLPDSKCVDNTAPCEGH